MLASLYIKNYAIIDSLEVDWSNGMTVITGETGAGKSIMIGAIQFVLGARADSKVLRDSEQKCIVEVKFTELKDHQNILKTFDFLDPTDEIIIRREILTNGKSRSFINDSPASVADLHSLSPLLIAIHQQFDHLDILEESVQFNIVDSYSESQSELDKYKLSYKRYKELLKEKIQLEQEHKKSSEEKDYLDFQYSELQQAQLKENEYKNIEEELTISSKSEELVQNLQAVSSLFQSEKGVLELIHEISKLLRPLQVIPSIQECSNRVQALHSEVKDIANELDRISDNSEFDPVKIKTLQERFDLLTRLLKKHRVQADHELIELRDSLEQKVKIYSNLDELISNKEKEIEKVLSSLRSQAKKLSDIRIQKSKKLPGEIVKMLQALGMEFAQLNIQIQEMGDLNENGMNKIEFLFSANKGSSLKVLKNQASGGELSRLNLVLKSIMSRKMKLPTLIFDEIDTGVSGQVALQMGNILREIGNDTQLICITHSPQVASRANQHYYVFKDTSAKQTNTKFKKLDKQDRNIELAKMLSGDPPSAAAIKNANELINSAN
ncbi:MAG: DNA repair protein RecN [Saprospiraceae bacterium]|nr:DNA repair protein RecN [Saprospiraceae bacterium]